MRLTGSMSIQQRDTMIDAFTHDPDVTVFLMSLKAGGVALNLTAASHVLLMSPWWNPAGEQTGFHWCMPSHDLVASLMQAMDAWNNWALLPAISCRSASERTQQSRALQPHCCQMSAKPALHDICCQPLVGPAGEPAEAS